MHVLLIIAAVLAGIVIAVCVGFGLLVLVAHLLAPYYDPS